MTLSSTRHLIVPKAETQLGTFLGPVQEGFELVFQCIFCLESKNLHSYLHCCNMF